MAARLIQMSLFLGAICSLDSRARFNGIGHSGGPVGGVRAPQQKLITTTKFDRAGCYIQIYRVNNLMVRK